MDTEENKNALEDTAELKKKLEYLESEAKKAFEKRDEYKKQLEEIKTKEDEEKGKYKDLYESLKSDAEAKTKALEDAAEKLKEITEAQRADILASLDKDVKIFAESLELDKLREFAKLQEKIKPPNLRASLKVGVSDRPKTAAEWRAKNKTF